MASVKQSRSAIFFLNLDITGIKSSLPTAHGKYTQLLDSSWLTLLNSNLSIVKYCSFLSISPPMLKHIATYAIALIDFSF